jgi:hypothetical protein
VTGGPEDPFAEQRRAAERAERERQIERSQPPEVQGDPGDPYASLREHVAASGGIIRTSSVDEVRAEMLVRPDPVVYYLHNHTGHIVRTYTPEQRDTAIADALRSGGMLSWSYVSHDFRNSAQKDEAERRYQGGQGYGRS